MELSPIKSVLNCNETKIGKESRGNRVRMGTLRDIPVPSTPFLISSVNARILARDEKGKAIGLEKTVGKGKVRFFSFPVYYTAEHHLKLLSAMIGTREIKSNAGTGDDSFHVEARFAGKQGILFVGNSHRMERSTQVWVNDPAGKGKIKLGRVPLPAQTGMLLPVRRSLSAGVSLLYALGELHEVQVNKKALTIRLCGPKGMPGRAVFETKKTIQTVKVDGILTSAKKQGDLLTVEYIQNGKEQLIELEC